MATTRRSFLQTLGIAAAGIAFRPKGSFLVPDNIVAYDGAPDLRWFLAESVAMLAAELPAGQFSAVSIPVNFFEGTHQLGIDIRWEDQMFERSKEELREWYMRPAMGQLAAEVLSLKARTSFPLELPRSIQHGARIRAPKNGLDLRFVQVWHPGHSWTDEETGKECCTRPGLMARYDILVA